MVDPGLRDGVEERLHRAVIEHVFDANGGLNLIHHDPRARRASLVLLGHLILNRGDAKQLADGDAEIVEFLPFPGHTAPTLSQTQIVRPR